MALQGCSPGAFVISEVQMWGVRWLFCVIPGSNFSLPSRTGWLGPRWSFFFLLRFPLNHSIWTDGIRSPPHAQQRLSFSLRTIALFFPSPGQPSSFTLSSHLSWEPSIVQKLKPQR